MAVKEDIWLRFWKKVNVNGPVPGHLPELGHCWVWVGGLRDDGYGRIKIERKYYRAPRISWALTFGYVPDDLFVLHRCDNPPCVRPSHLWLGTHADNMADMTRKGRAGGGSEKGHLRGPAKPFPRKREWYVRGARHCRAKLTDEMVLAMRRLRGEGASYYELARRFPVSVTVARKAVLGITWSHL